MASFEWRRLTPFPCRFTVVAIQVNEFGEEECDYGELLEITKDIQNMGFGQVPIAHPISTGALGGSRCSDLT